MRALVSTTVAVALALVLTAPPARAATDSDHVAVNPSVTTACVILLHGMSRTDFSMLRLEGALRNQGYAVANIHYDSREHRIEELARQVITRGREQCAEAGASPVHFATHSLGGILVRYYLRDNAIPELGRVVMMAPPNQGSEIIDLLGELPGFELFSGEPAQQLGTSPDSIPRQLGPVDFEVGVIAGNRSINPLLSMALPDRDDGKVTVENTKVEGMADFIELPYSHTFIMQRQESIDQVIHFLTHGHFNHPDPDASRSIFAGLPDLLDPGNR